MPQRKKNFIQSAIKHPGAFRAYCLAKRLLNKRGKVGSKCISAGLKSSHSLIKKRANLAKTLAMLRKRKQAKGRKRGKGSLASYPKLYSAQGQYVKKHGYQGGAFLHNPFPLMPHMPPPFISPLPLPKPRKPLFTTMPLRPRLQAMGRRRKHRGRGWDDQIAYMLFH